MTKLQKQISFEIDLLIKELLAKYEEKGMRASGKWAESLEAQIVGNRGIILGEPYTQQLEHGRTAGKFPPIDMIEQWIQDKGILAIDADITLKSLAFLIARKIARQGYDREGYGGVELVTEVLTPQRMQKAIEGISFVGAFEIVELIKSDLKELWR